MRSYHFWIVGGDRRQAALARVLSEDGHAVHTYGLEHDLEQAENLAASDLNGAEAADCLVLPLPAQEGEFINAPLAARAIPVDEVLNALRPGQIVCAGRAEKALWSKAEVRGLVLFDYFRREELAVANAVPTSEGAIQIALEELPITLHNARCLVIGYGRLGKVLARQLRGLGARVSVAARSCADLAWAQVWNYGVERSDRLAGWMCAYDLVVNTVPARILGREELRDLKENCLIIDLASKPGGVDGAAARELGIKVIHALSLPGKTAPVTAALGVKSALYNILNELGV